MGLMDKILDVMKLDPDDDFDYDNDFDYDEEEPVKKPVFKKTKAEETVVEEKRHAAPEKPQPKPVSKITPMRAIRNNNNSKVANDMEVCVIRPTGIEDEREIADTLLDGRTVVLNIEGVSSDLAQRIIDFSSGSCYAIGGNLQKISNYIFIITPANVEISGDFQSIVDGFDRNTFKNEF
ncbi:MAG: cell division protein SepF [Lachnospiraceae bacterium]|jgi:cell division inhibitor SepF|nr:cell division protein SepF [Lachnospiraceae bacterium]